jgi:acyl-CoA synthetase (AMP-forming)/AMP-acid ligase II
MPDTGSKPRGAATATRCVRPPAHSWARSRAGAAEQAVSHLLSLAPGACVHFAESLEKLPDNLREVRPHIFVGVPRVWEKIQAGIQPPGLTRARSGAASWPGRARSASPAATPTRKGARGRGATGSRRYRLGRAGCAIPGTELRVAEDGEILMRGPHVFKGYAKNEGATRETLVAEGWVHSGDVGEIDADGFLRVTDRMKEILITSRGKNIAPQHLEGKLKQRAAQGRHRRPLRLIVSGVPSSPPPTPPERPRALTAARAAA